MTKDAFVKRVFKDARHTLTSPYGWRVHPITHIRTFHYGEDYGTYHVKCPLYSPVYGVVKESAYNLIRGNFVTITTLYGLVRMQHMSSRAVEVGQKVVVGTKLGLAGTSGSSTGVHLHIEYKTPVGDKLDPDTFIALYKDPVIKKAYSGKFPTAPVSRTSGTIANIKSWQAFLCWYGADVKIDGEFGPDTELKTKVFQRLNHLTMDGSVGAKTIAKAKVVLR